MPVSPPTASTLVDMLRRQAEQYRDKVAFSFSWNGDDEHRTQLTYHELDVKARAIACWLQQQGAAGERALVLCRPGLDFIAGFFGCLYAGVVAVPVHLRLAPRLTSVVPDAQPRFALGTAETPADVREEVDLLVDGQPVRWLNMDEVGTDAENWVPPQIDTSTPAMMQYTSGTTSSPKGVVVTHGNLLNNLAAVGPAWGGNESAIVVSWLPQHHDMGLIGATLSPLCVGCTTMLMAPAAFIERPMRWLEAVSRHHATATAAPNFAFQLCVERSTPEEIAALDLSSLSVISNGGDPVRAATLRAFAEEFGPAGFRLETLLPSYGLAEATLLVACGSESPVPMLAHLDRAALGEGRVVDVAPRQQLSAVELISCGRPQGGQQVIIVNPETRRPCAPDELGEIWVSGPNVAQGYWGRPEESEQTFSAFLADTGHGPFLRTGDLGFLRFGELFVTGRYQDLIVIDGRNYYPTDIELTVQRRHPALVLGRGAVFAVTPESDAAEKLVVVQEVDLARVGGDELTDIAHALQAAVAHHHGIDAHVVLVEHVSIPTTSSGKIQRGRCRQKFLDGTLKVLG
jgi:fatty acid CoA ligase FadD32